MRSAATLVDKHAVVVKYIYHVVSAREELKQHFDNYFNSFFSGELLASGRCPRTEFHSLTMSLYAASVIDIQFKHYLDDCFEEEEVVPEAVAVSRKQPPPQKRQPSMDSFVTTLVNSLYIVGSLNEELKSFLEDCFESGEMNDFCFLFTLAPDVTRDLLLRIVEKYKMEGKELSHKVAEQAALLCAVSDELYVDILEVGSREFIDKVEKAMTPTVLSNKYLTSIVTRGIAFNRDGLLSSLKHLYESGEITSFRAVHAVDPVFALSVMDSLVQQRKCRGECVSALEEEISMLSKFGHKGMIIVKIGEA